MNNRRSQREHSRMLDTKTGMVEVAIKGAGFPVLVVRGISGHAYVGAEYQIIAPAPLSQRNNAATQADAYVAILDALEIDRVALVGPVAGALAVLQFGMRHPSRCAALVMLCAGTRPNASIDSANLMTELGSTQGLHVPTLIVHARDEAVVPVSHATHLASLIPRAHLFVVQGGDHFGVGHVAEARSEICSFIAEHHGQAHGAGAT